MTRRWYSVPQAAIYFGMKAGTLYSLAGRGLLPDGAVLRLGRQVRINIEIIEKEGIKKNER